MTSTMTFIRRATTLIAAAMLTFVYGLPLMGQVNADNNSGASIVSLGNNNTLPDNGSFYSQITPDGNNVVFESYADNLTNTPTNGQNTQIYERNLSTGVTQMVSVNAGGVAGDAASNSPTVSPNGRFVTFASTADNLVGGAANGASYCYVRDTQQGTTTLLNPFGSNASDTDCEAVSNDGNNVILSSNQVITNTLPGGYSCNSSYMCIWGGDSYIFNRSAGTVQPIPIDSAGNAGVYNSARGVWASYLAESASIASNQQVVTFWSNSPLINGVAGAKVYERNLSNGSLQALDLHGYPVSNNPSISANGSYISYAVYDSNYQTGRLYLHNIQTNADTEVDTATDGTPTNSYPGLSSVSSDGTYVGFTSTATNLVAGGSSADQHLFVRNMINGVTTQADVNSQGQQAHQNISSNLVSQEPSVTDAGGVAFWSYANNFNSAPTPQVYYTPPTSVAPVFTSAASARTNARDPFNFVVTTSGTPTPSITESGSLPTGINFKDNGDGTATFSGQASPVNQGYYFITLTATNSAGSTTQNFVLTVNNAQTAPTFLSANSTTATTGTPFSFTVNTTGNPLPDISKVTGSGQLPNGVTFVDNGDGTATLSGTPTGKNSNSTHTFTIKAKNKNGSVTQNFSLYVN